MSREPPPAPRRRPQPSASDPLFVRINASRGRETRFSLETLGTAGSASSIPPGTAPASPPPPTRRQKADLRSGVASDQPLRVKAAFLYGTLVQNKGYSMAKRGKD